MNQELIAETLTAHQRQNASHCLCGWSKLGASHPAHQAAVLAPLIVAGQAEALREAAAEMDRLWSIGKKPYAACSKDELADYNPYVHMRPEAWLRTRATLIEAVADTEGRALVQAIHDRKAQG